MADVLADWTAELGERYGAVHLFDLPFLSSVYRVLLLPGGLQVDVSFTPGAEFGALGPDFALLFGTAVERRRPQPASARHLFGMAAHHAVRARVCVERGRAWQADFWLAEARHQALVVLGAFAGVLPASLEPEELRRALGRTIGGVLVVARDVSGLPTDLVERLRELI